MEGGGWSFGEGQGPADLARPCLSGGGGRKGIEALGENRWFQKLKDEEIGGCFLYILVNMA